MNNAAAEKGIRVDLGVAQNGALLGSWQSHPVAPALRRPSLKNVKCHNLVGKISSLLVRNWQEFHVLWPTPQLPHSHTPTLPPRKQA